jgi:hypothetical protein
VWRVESGWATAPLTLRSSKRRATPIVRVHRGAIVGNGISTEELIRPFEKCYTLLSTQNHLKKKN